MENVIMATKMPFPLSYLHLSLAHSKGQIQVREHFDLVCRVDVDEYGKRYHCHQIGNAACSFNLNIFL